MQEYYIIKLIYEINAQNTLVMFGCYDIRELYIGVLKGYLFHISYFKMEIRFFFNETRHNYVASAEMWPKMQADLTIAHCIN